MEKQIYKRISEIMKGVDAIKKGKKNQQQGYMFRGIDDMYNALHDLFSDNEVFITSNVLESKREERQTKNGGALIYTIAKCQFTFWTTDGSSVESILEGEAMDSADKSTNKSMSTALKYALMQMFLIPTEERLDTEYETPEVIGKEAQAAAQIEAKKQEIKAELDKCKTRPDVTVVYNKYKSDAANIPAIMDLVKEATERVDPPKHEQIK